MRHHIATILSHCAGVRKLPSAGMDLALIGDHVCLINGYSLMTARPPR